MSNKRALGPWVAHLRMTDLWQPLCLVERNLLCNFGRRHHEEQFCEMILKLDQWFRMRCRFKDISYLELWWPFCYHLFNFGRGHYEEKFCEFISNLGQRFRCRLKDFLSGALANLLFRSRTIYALLKVGIMGNIHVNYVLKRVSFGSKDCTKELKLECAYFLGQTS